MLDVHLIVNKRYVGILEREDAACLALPSNDSAIGEILCLPGIFGMIGTDKDLGGGAK